MNNNKNRTLLSFLLIFLLTACTKLPEYDAVPVIELESVTKYTVQEGVDSVIVTIRFNDGDGDIGARENESVFNAFVKDSRFNQSLLNYKIPYIEPSGRVKALSGTIDFRLYQPFNCRPNVSDTDTFSYEIYILDRKGNQSNSIFTETFTIECQ